MVLPLRSLDARSMLRAAEESAETIYSSVWLIILVFLVMLFFAMEAVHHHNDIAAISLALYGVLTAVSLAVAWKRIFRPWIPYTFVTCDIGFIGLPLLEMTRDIGFPPAANFGIPASGLMFLVLTHAALRFRPALAIYAACVSLLFVTFSGSLLPVPRGSQSAGLSRLYASHLRELVYWKVLPISINILMSFMLWLISITMSMLLDQAVAHAGRSIRLSRFSSPNLVDRLSRAGAGGPRLGNARVGGFASPASYAAHARIAVTAANLLTFRSDHRMGDGQFACRLPRPGWTGLGIVTGHRGRREL